MTSRRTTKHCYVYITLPGQTEAVTAARYELADPDGSPVGRLVYGRSYLSRSDAVEIDPVELRLGARIDPTTKLHGVYGALRDASPDYWGRLIIERYKKVQKLDEMEYLLQSSDARAGALAFGHGKLPPAPVREFNSILDLEELQELAMALLEDATKSEDAKAEQARRLMMLGSPSLGGARPKSVIQDGQGLWVAKFNRPDHDRWDSAMVEHTMLRLAKAAGITAAPSKVVKIGDRNVLLVKRFDRERVGEGSYRRARMVSALTLLRSEDTVEAKAKGEWSYLRLVEELRRISGSPQRDAKELFRRMCFNAASSNLDDHARNHAVIAMDQDWRLSPAYDLTPTPSVGMERYLQMTVGDQGNLATAENLLSQAKRFLLDRSEAEAIVRDVSTCVRTQWYSLARKEHVTDADCATIRPAFENDGFSFVAAPAPKKSARKRARKAAPKDGTAKRKSARG